MRRYNHCLSLLLVPLAKTQRDLPHRWGLASQLALSSSSKCSLIQRSASKAAMHPLPALVIACGCAMNRNMSILRHVIEVKRRNERVVIYKTIEIPHLFVTLVLDIACGKHALDTCERGAGFSKDVAVLIEVDLTLEELCRRIVAYVVLE